MPKGDFTPDISADDLSPIVRAIAGGELEGAWETKAIGNGIGLGTIGIFRLSGRSRQASGSAEPWTAILKIVDVEKEHTGLREYELAQSSDFQSIIEGLRPAKCFGTQERSDAERWIWTEDLAGGVQPPWTLDQYLYVARDVGVFHGRSLLEMPAGDWDYLGIYGAVMRGPFFLAALDNLENTASHELSGQIFGTTSVDAIKSVFAEFNEVGRALRNITTVFAHNDCHADNLYPIETDGVLIESVAIDWATAGLGPIGEDVGNLSGVGALWFSIDVDDFEGYEKAIFDRYIEGAESVAGSINIDHARTGYLAGLGYWGLAKMMNRAYAGSTIPQAVNRWRSLTGMSEYEVARKWGVLTDKLYPYAIECVERLGV
jgi:hypothetical protein